VAPLLGNPGRGGGGGWARGGLGHGGRLGHSHGELGGFGGGDRQGGGGRSKARYLGGHSLGEPAVNEAEVHNHKEVVSLS